LSRREFDLAHKEAVDESAEWRYRFDEERERANKCIKELTEVCCLSQGVWYLSRLGSTISLLRWKFFVWFSLLEFELLF